MRANPSGSWVAQKKWGLVGLFVLLAVMAAPTVVYIGRTLLHGALVMAATSPAPSINESGAKASAQEAVIIDGRENAAEATPQLEVTQEVEWVASGDSSVPMVPRCPVCKRGVAQESTGCFSGHRFTWRPRPRTQCTVCNGDRDLSCTRENVKTACDAGSAYRRVTLGRLQFRQYTYCAPNGEVKAEWSGHERDLSKNFTCTTCEGDQRFVCWRCKGAGSI